MKIAATILSLALLGACATQEPVVVEEPYVPEVVFPEFPDPEGKVEFDEESGEVTMQLEYWQQVTDYVIDVRATAETYEIYQETYGDSRDSD